MTHIPTGQTFSESSRPRLSKQLGLMVVHSPKGPILRHDLNLAKSLGATFVEMLPRWNDLPDPAEIRHQVADSGLQLWSVHGPWGGQSINATKVDLSDLNHSYRLDSVDDVLRALDWSAALGAQVLVVHPGGLSAPEDLSQRSDKLSESIDLLSREAAARGLRLGLENMPRGVFPGSNMADLARIVRLIGHDALGLVLDTGHARISGDLCEETIAAEGLLISTHVHDNDGRSDSHRPPGEGMIDWPAWFASLDRINYTGPIMLECVKALRDRPEPPTAEWLGWWRALLQGNEQKHLRLI